MNIPNDGNLVSSNINVHTLQHIQSSLDINNTDINHTKYDKAYDEETVDYDEAYDEETVAPPDNDNDDNYDDDDDAFVGLTHFTCSTRPPVNGQNFDRRLLSTILDSGTRPYMPGKRATSRVERAIMLLTALKPDRMGAERARLLNKEQRYPFVVTHSLTHSEIRFPA